MAGTTGPFGFVWTADSGLYDFGHDAGPPGYTGASGISGDGHVVVGASSPDVSTPPLIAYRWSGPGTFESLGTIAPYTFSEAKGVSNDGSIIAGNVSVAGNGSRAFRWTQGGGIQLLPGSTLSRANAISRDGNVIVGEAGVSSGLPFAVRWIGNQGPFPLTGLPGTFDSYARGVNFDGSFVVGVSGGPAVQPTLWHDGVPMDLGRLDNWSGMGPSAVSDDGSVVVGIGTSLALGGELGIMWTAATGWVPLGDYLSSLGVSIPAGVHLGSCTAISADGMTIVGTTTGPAGISEGYVATIPTPGAAPLLAIAAMALRRRRPGRAPTP